MAFTDDFNRADEQLVASPNWTRVGGSSDNSAVVESNAVRFNDTSSAGAAFFCPDQGSVDHYTEADYPSSSSTGSNSLFVCVRMSNANNNISARQRLGNWRVHRREDGTFTELHASSSSGDLPGARMRLEIVGTTLKFLVNDDELLSTTESFNSDQTGQGFVCRSDTMNPAIDNFEAGALDAGGEPPSITGDATLLLTAAATMDYTMHRALAGDAMLLLTPAAGMVYSRHFALVGDATLLLTPAATLDFSRQQSLVGDATLLITPEAGLAYQQHPSIEGDVTLLLTPDAHLQFGEPMITGDVTIILTPAASMAFGQHRTLEGDATVLLTPAASKMQFNIHRRIQGAASLLFTVNGTPVYTPKPATAAVTIDAAATELNLHQRKLSIELSGAMWVE